MRLSQIKSTRFKCQKLKKKMIDDETDYPDENLLGHMFSVDSSFLKVLFFACTSDDRDKE